MRFLVVVSITSLSQLTECFMIIRLTTSFGSNSYNNVPPTIMELMKDLKGFSDIIVKNVRVWSVLSFLVFREYNSVIRKSS